MRLGRNRRMPLPQLSQPNPSRSAAQIPSREPRHDQKLPTDNPSGRDSPHRHCPCEARSGCRERCNRDECRPECNGRLVLLYGLSGCEPHKLGQFSTKGARSNIRRPMRWRPLLNLHLPAGPDQETTSGYKQRTSYIRTKCIAPKFRCSITSLEAASTGKAIRPLQFALLPTSMHAYALRKPAA